MRLNLSSVTTKVALRAIPAPATNRRGMHMRRQMGYILVTAALILATSVQAGTAGNTPAEQACLNAFMNDLAGKYQPAPRLREAKFEEESGAAATPGGAESWDLTATNPRNNRTVARATCVVRSSGADVELLQPSYQ